MGALKYAWRLCKQYWYGWLTVFLLGIICVIAMMLLPQVPQLLIDRIINPVLGADAVINPSNPFTPILNMFASNDYWGMFLAILVIFLAIALVRYLGHYLRWNFAHIFGEKASLDIREKLYKKLLSQNSTALSRYTSGDLMTIQNSDPTAIKDLFAIYLSLFFDQFVILGFSIYFLSTVSIYFMILPLAMGVVIVFLTLKYTSALKKNYIFVRDASVKLTTVVQENVTGVRVVRASATETAEKQKFYESNTGLMNSYNKHTDTIARYNIVFNLFNQIINIGSIIIGIVLAVGGLITAGMFTTFLAYVVMISQVLVSIANVSGQIQNGLVSSARISDFLQVSDVITDIDNPREIAGQPNIRVNEISVQMEEQVNLHNISLNIPYGTKLGIMGKTGSGKSVLLKTLARFFDASRGQVLINNVDIKHLRVADVRKQFSYVMQDVFLFSDTVASNIALARPDAPIEQITKCAIEAEADGFVSKLPEGYDTVIGERGIGLSGGQKQRLSIARALLKNAPIIMLDDCTSALDMATEQRIWNTLMHEYSDRTIIICSHRASSVAKCDMIVYIDQGVIVEQGTHSDLLEQNGQYAQTFYAQEASRKASLE